MEKELNLNQKEDVVSLMASSTPDTWDSNVDRVRSANNGKLPDFWIHTILQSGLCAHIMGEEFAQHHLNVGHKNQGFIKPFEQY